MIQSYTQQSLCRFWLRRIRLIGGNHLDGKSLQSDNSHSGSKCLSVGETVINFELINMDMCV